MESKVYLATWCADCKNAEKFFDKMNVKVCKIYIDLDEAAAAELERITGKRGVPYFVVDGRWIKGYDSSVFNPALVSEALCLK